MNIDKKLLFKSMVYRLFRILILLVIAMLFTDNFEASFGISLLDALVATAYYYYFDRFYSYIHRRYFE